MLAGSPPTPSALQRKNYPARALTPIESHPYTISRDKSPGIKSLRKNPRGEGAFLISNALWKQTGRGRFHPLRPIAEANPQ